MYRRLALALSISALALIGAPGASAAAGLAAAPLGNGCGVADLGTLGGMPSGTSAGRGFSREPGAMDKVPQDTTPGPKAPAGFARTVPVYFHVITDGDLGDVSNSQIDAQIRVLNRAFAGGYGGVSTPFQFVLAGVTRTDNAEWFAMGYNSQAERRAKAALRQGGADALNLYSTNGADDYLLGWATFPSNYSSQPDKDGVVLHYGSLPRGDIDNYNLGQTATHETGHWFGLYHTFQNGCSATGDQVDDTPPERTPTSGCPEGKDTCKQAGLDPIHNYMDYSYDGCYSEFSAGQSDRMASQFLEYRAGP